jgi:hypothetical protein
MVNIDKVMAKKYGSEKVNVAKMKWISKGRRPVTKSEANQKRITPPYSMKKLCDLLLVDEYHDGCIDSIAKNVVKKFDCTDGRVMGWWKVAQTPPKSNKLDLLRQLVKYDQACGNGFLIKLRNMAGEWVGFQRLLPHEAIILENYDDAGFLRPNYLQHRNMKAAYFDGQDIIHMMEETHKSEAWGLRGLQVAANVEILKEIKTLDYNNFRNGLFIDYLILVEGLLDDDDDNDGEEEASDSGFNVIKTQFETAIANKKQHSSIILETGDPNVKIRVEKLRKDLTADGQKQLETKYRSGIFAYHRVPARLVSQETPGKLGGDNNSDLQLFYFNKVKPLQEALANILAEEFKQEFGWEIDPADFDFGNLLDDYKTDEQRFFDEARGK